MEAPWRSERAKRPVEGPAVSGLRKLCFLSRYLQCQELVADLLRRPVPVCRVKTLPIVTQFDVARNITHGLFAGGIECAVQFSARGWFFAAIFIAPAISGVRKWLAIAHPMTSLLKQSITVAR